MAETTDVRARKQAIREEAHARRRAQPDKDELSQAICAVLQALPAYGRARTVLYYIDVRAEVRTRQALPVALQGGRRIVVPYCVEGELELFHLTDMEELSVGAYKILEPREDLRVFPEKRVAVEDIDLIVAPGVAFDRQGARMGHGFGYYDKLLWRARPDCPIVALAFECQLFDEIPVDEHDVFMDQVVTESRVYPGRGRSQA